MKKSVMLHFNAFNIINAKNFNTRTPKQYVPHEPKAHLIKKTEVCQ